VGTGPPPQRLRVSGQPHFRPILAGGRFKATNLTIFVLTPIRHGFPQRIRSKIVEDQFGKNVVLYFPSDRFELPDWLNEQSLAAELRFPVPVNFKGQTARRIFSRVLLRPTLEWFKGVLLDSTLASWAESRDKRILGYLCELLGMVLDARPRDR